MMTNLEHMNKNILAEALAENIYGCRCCSYHAEDECEKCPPPCAEGIRKWFDEESQYDD